jgi:hypothetical protein
MRVDIDGSECVQQSELCNECVKSSVR